MKRLLIRNIGEIATPRGKKLLKGEAMKAIEVIHDGAIYIEDGVIRKVGTTQEVVRELDKERIFYEAIEAKNKCVIPGFVDSHTHFIFGGYRPDEFIARLNGAQYLEIHKMGGGIQSTVEQTRKASFEELYKLGLHRLKDMLKQGVTTVEGKSGYGLDEACEMKQLEVMKQLGEQQAVEIVPTYLGAHSIPLEYKGRSDAYVDYMLEQVLPKVKEKKLADFCDVFCEEGVFGVEQSRKLLEGAKALGFKIKLHADEIVSLGGSLLAGELQATSADHLLMISDKGIKALAEQDVAATLLPCTAFCLDKPYAPARKMIDSGCGIALASDLNPGSCFSNSIPLMLALAVIHMKMTMEEALTALTLNGAAAIGKAEEIGSIEVGKKADLLILKYPSYKFLVYNTGANLVEKVLKGGECVYESQASILSGL